MIKKLLFFLLCFPVSILCKISVLCESDFYHEKVPTELTALRVLKDYNSTTGLEYVAAPWSVLINKGELSKIPDIEFDNGVTVCQHIRYEVIIPILKKMGIKFLFTPHVYREHDGITVLPFPHMAVNGIGPSHIKDIKCSFVGAEYTHLVRKKIFDQLSGQDDFFLKKRDKWQFYLPDKQADLFKIEYQNILSRSAFSLCPRGTGASTIRFWESLQAGAIPVLISDAMRLPNNFDWNRCVIRVSESDVDQIPLILSNISKDEEKSMREACLDAYYAFSGNNFVSPILNYFDIKI